MDSPTGAGSSGATSMSWLPPMGGSMPPHYAPMSAAAAAAAAAAANIKHEWPPRWGAGDFGTLLAADQHDMGVRYLD